MPFRIMLLTALVLFSNAAFAACKTKPVFSVRTQEYLGCEVVIRKVSHFSSALEINEQDCQAKCGEAQQALAKEKDPTVFLAAPFALWGSTTHTEQAIVKAEMAEAQQDPRAPRRSYKDFISLFKE